MYFDRICINFYGSRISHENDKKIHLFFNLRYVFCFRFGQKLHMTLFVDLFTQNKKGPIHIRSKVNIKRVISFQNFHEISTFSQISKYYIDFNFWCRQKRYISFFIDLFMQNEKDSIYISRKSKTKRDIAFKNSVKTVTHSVTLILMALRRE